MSGPKSSRYTLTAEQLKRIHEEQERLRKELEEKARQERESKEAKEYITGVRTRTYRLLSTIREYEQKAHTVRDVLSEETQSKLTKLYSKIEQLDIICRNSIRNDYSELMKTRDIVEEQFNNISTEGGNLISAIKEMILQEQIQKDEIIAKGMQVSFAYVGSIEEPKDLLQERINTELENLLRLDISYKLRTEVERAVEQFDSIKEDNARSNFAAITLEPLKKRCTSEDAFRKANANRYKKAIDRYVSLCRQLEEREITFEYTEEGLLALEKNVLDYEKRVLYDAEQSYISSSIDEVMREMGYVVIGHRNVRKKSGKSFKSKLLTYEDGTVVNVTESSNGQITMEIGGIDSIDRLPDANERVSLQKKMEGFCRDFREIERHLTERGIILDTRLAMAPPEEKYAQIINYTDYDLKEDFNRAIARKSSAIESQKIQQLRNE